MSLVALGLLSAGGTFLAVLLYGWKSPPGRWRQGLWLTSVIAVSLSVGRFLTENLQALSRYPALKLVLVFLYLTILAILLKRYGLTWAHLKASSVLQALSPLIAILWIQAIFYRNQQIRSFSQPAQTAPSAWARPPGQDIWVLLFDELDYKITFEDGFISQMPAFRRLQAETFGADQCFPPAGDTLQSVPGMLFGSPVSASRGLSADKMRLDLPDGRHLTWTGGDSLLADLQQQGRSVAALGFYLPYTRLMPQPTPESYFAMFDHERLCFKESATLHGALMVQALEIRMPGGRSLLARLFSEGRLADENRASLEELRSRQLNLVQAPPLDFYWVHFPVPHGPSLLPMDGTYLGNLKVADQTLGAFRSAMEERGRWQRATIIVLADHWLRKANDIPNSPWTREHRNRWDRKNHQVPFFIKFPFQKQGQTYHSAFNLSLLRLLVNALASREITQPGTLGAWLDLHRGSLGESPSTLALP